MLDPVGNDLDGQPFGVGYGFLYTALHRIRSRLPGKMRIVPSSYRGVSPLFSVTPGDSSQALCFQLDAGGPLGSMRPGFMNLP